MSGCVAVFLRHTSPLGLETRAMGIILFLVDTSASMNQRTFLGTSYLDVAKGAVDTFMKVRTRGRGGCGIFRTPVQLGGILP